jgi:hypothetical protein
MSYPPSGWRKSPRQLLRICTQPTVALKPLICDAAYAVFRYWQPPSTGSVPSRPADRVQNCGIACALCVGKLAYKVEHAEWTAAREQHSQTVRPRAAQYADAHMYHGLVNTLAGHGQRLYQVCQSHKCQLKCLLQQEVHPAVDQEQRCQRVTLCLKRSWRMHTMCQRHS